MFIQELFTFSSCDLCLILVSLIRKNSTLENKIRNQFTVRSGHSNHSVHRGINPPSKTPPLFLANSPPSFNPLNLQTVQAPFFRQFPPLYHFFCELPPLKVRFFSGCPKYQSFSFLTPFCLLKVTKFLVKISQFEFLVMTEKNIFVYKLFLLLNISDFSFFFVKIATPLEKVSPLFSSKPLSKLRSCQGPLFLKIC